MKAFKGGFKISEEKHAKKVAELRESQKQNRKALIERLLARSEKSGDMWDEMAKELIDKG